jgi:uncharacterized membrane protein YoaK (UPF0700 family)
MSLLMQVKNSPVPALLSFNGGFVDAAGFLALQGLFTSHVTGNFVTFAAAVVLGTHGLVAKLLALPEFIFIVALTRVAARALDRRRLPRLRPLLAGKVLFLLAFFLLGIRFGPFPDSDAAAALVCGFAGVAGMAIQNAIQRMHYASIPPTTIMTGNTTQLALDMIDLVLGVDASNADVVKERFSKTMRGILWFAAGCALAGILFYWVKLWCLALPVAVGATTAILSDDGKDKRFTGGVTIPDTATVL